MADVVRKTERRINALAAKRSKNAGWEPEIIGFTGYGNAERVRVFGRVLLKDPAKKRDEERNKKRGFWQFFTVELADFPVTITAGDRTVETTTDSNGYIEVLIRNHGLEPGWHEITINDTPAEVLILSPETKYGIVSDIDDTVLVTMLPRALIAAYNSWVKETDERKAVAGFSEFYAQLRRRYASKTDEDTDVPVIYLSTGAWNTFSTLKKFLHRNNLPMGPLLLTDWGPHPPACSARARNTRRCDFATCLLTFPKSTGSSSAMTVSTTRSSTAQLQRNIRIKSRRLQSATSLPASTCSPTARQCQLKNWRTRRSRSSRAQTATSCSNRLTSCRNHDLPPPCPYSR